MSKIWSIVMVACRYLTRSTARIEMRKRNGMGFESLAKPIILDVEGSLLFNMSHAVGTRPGPKSLGSRIPTLWTVHPVTKIVFEAQK